MANLQVVSGWPITSVSVAGYKSIAKKQVIEIRRLTILAGANNSGKSSIMQPVLLLKQTLESTSDTRPLRLNGPNVQLPASNQVVSRFKTKGMADSFSCELNGRDGRSIAVRFENERGGFVLSGMDTKDGNGRVHISPDMTSDEIKRVFPRAAEWERPFIHRNRCFFEIRSHGLSEPISPGRDFGMSIEGVLHIPGLRGNTERTFPVTGAGPEFPGVFTDYVASIIQQWQDDRDMDRLDALGKSLKDLGLTWKVKASPAFGSKLELLAGRLPRRTQRGPEDLVSIADMGVGVSQVLPLLVALESATPVQMVYVEEPESHLHPRAQVQLARILADAAKRGITVVMETHSSLLLRRIQTLVAQGELSPSLVKLHWFQRTMTTGSTQVQSADLDRDGAFGEWPADFDDVTLESERNYLDAVDSVLSK